jgi:hypothetical protein
LYFFKFQILSHLVTTTLSIATDSSFWSFDNNTLDSLSGYDGVGVNSPTYYKPGINGYGSALSVNRSIGQYVNVTKYRNFTYTSFTIEMWFYPTVISSGDGGLFGQFYDTNQDQSLQCIIRSDVMFFGFFYDDLYGSGRIQNNTWYHVAFVFNYSALTKAIYLNGILDAHHSSSSYKGLEASILMGKVDDNAGDPSYFFG